jgi:hypothetical protein
MGLFGLNGLQVEKREGDAPKRDGAREQKPSAGSRKGRVGPSYSPPPPTPHPPHPPYLATFFAPFLTETTQGCRVGYRFETSLSGMDFLNALGLVTLLTSLSFNL